MEFKPPSESDCLAAIGIEHVPGEAQETGAAAGSYQLLWLDKYQGMEVPTVLLPALVPDRSMFEPIPRPGRHDWLANHPEKGETFKQFTKTRLKNIPDKVRQTIYIMPLTFFEKSVPEEVLSLLAEFASCFFTMQVKVLNTTSFSDDVPNRRNPYTGQQQVHGERILVELKNRLPKDAFCLSAITLCDLYPRESWNFVFGVASLVERVGVYSLARYMPGFEEQSEPSTENMTSEEKSALLRRSCQVMCHEMGHMFGLTHCIYYSCMMNGSNHFVENDQKPLHLCPVCLRKLHITIKFDILERYWNLHQFCQKNSLNTAVEWFDKRLKSLSVNK